MNAPSDVELVRAWRSGERTAGERLFERYYDPVARFFFNKTDEQSCADLIQRTFLACVEGLARLEDAANFRSYLFSTAYRLLCKHYETRHHARMPLDLMVATAQDCMQTPTQALAAKQEQRLLLAALRAVPVEYQIVLELVYWESMTAEEIGRALVLPLGTAKTRIRRGRQLLEKAMAELAESRVLLQSTVTGLEQWAAAVRAKVSEATSGARKAPQ